jgi:hypothetical protein
MTSQHGRLYALALGLVVFFLAWAVIAARPWVTTTSADPRLRVLAARETQLRHEAKRVQKVVAARWARYRVRLKQRRALIAKIASTPAPAPVAAAAAGPVQIVTLPAHVITRTS